ncbi:hypothetical protein Tco_1413111 [Tanacetum coccineum]
MMANLYEDIQCNGFDTRPPMLDRTDFEYWQQHIRLYCLGKDNGVNILKSIDEGPFKMGKFRETLAEGALHLGPERDRVFADLTPEEKERFKADIRATNILLQGLPKDIYTLINHYTDAKDIWDNVKMLLEGSELTKDERESQLYDEFEHFRQNKGETIHEYYVRFTKLINDMRNIKMTMPKMQLNSKFMNNMLPKWVRFITTVKLNRGLKQSNYDQLYAYLKQHKAHANENKMMLERYNKHAIDPLAFVSNVSPQQYPTQSSTIPQSAYIPPITHQPQLSDNIHLDSEVKGIMLGEQLQLEMGEFRTEWAMQILTNMFDDDVDEAPVQDLALNEDNVFQAYQCDAFDCSVDEAPTAQTIVGEYHEVHEMQNDVQPNYVVDLHAEYTSDSNIISYEQYVKDNAVQVVQKLLKKELHSVKMQINSTINHNKLITEEVITLKQDFKQKENKYLEEFLDMKQLKEKVEDKLYKQDQSLQTVHMLCKPKPFYDEKKKVAIGYKNPLYLTNAKQVQPALYNGLELVKTTHASAIVHDSKDTLETAEKTRIGMLKKM